MQLLRHAIETVLDALAPPGCAACDEPCSGATFCAACGPPEPLAAPLMLDGTPVAVIGSYQPPLSTAIVRFKYAARPELSRHLAALLRPQLAQLELPRGAVLAPVPLHPKRLASRGYNQAALLATELSRGLGLPSLPRLLERTRVTERQVGKGRSERLDNLNDAFALRRAGFEA